MTNKPMQKVFIGAVLLYSAIFAGCSSQKNMMTEQPAESLNKNEDRCVALERHAVGANSQEMGRLFGLAQERYEGAMPCIGAAARFRVGDAASACDLMPLPYILDRVHAGSPAQLAGLRDGDAIDSVADRPIRFPMDFDAAILGAQPGSFLPVRITRGDRSFIGQVRVGIQLPGDGAKCSVLPAQ